MRKKEEQPPKNAKQWSGLLSCIYTFMEVATISNLMKFVYLCTYFFILQRYKISWF